MVQSLGNSAGSRDKSSREPAAEDIFLALQVAQRTLGGLPAHLEPKKKGENGYFWPDFLCQWLSNFVPVLLPLAVARVFLRDMDPCQQLMELPT